MEQDPPSFLLQGRKVTHPTLCWGWTRLKQSETRRSIKLLHRLLQHSQVLPRNMIQLTLNSERWAGQWPKGCSIHQIFGSLRMLMHSWPRTSLWFQNRRGNWKVISSKRAFSKTLRKFLATKPVSNLRTRCLHQWDLRELLWSLCTNSEMRSPESRCRWMILWIAVGLLSFQMIVSSSDWHINRGWWVTAWWSGVRSRHSVEDPGESQR